MLYYNRIDVSEGVDINKTSAASKEYLVCKYLYFLDKGFRFQPAVCNGFHVVLMMSIDSWQRVPDPLCFLRSPSKITLQRVSVSDTPFFEVPL